MRRATAARPRSARVPPGRRRGLERRRLLAKPWGACIAGFGVFAVSLVTIQGGLKLCRKKKYYPIPSSEHNSCSRRAFKFQLGLLPFRRPLLTARWNSYRARGCPEIRFKLFDLPDLDERSLIQYPDPWLGVRPAAWAEEGFWLP